MPFDGFRTIDPPAPRAPARRLGPEAAAWGGFLVSLGLVFVAVAGLSLALLEGLG